jgi:D-psicose/D-tagatose/L-ribulose 3-epimerase
MNMLLWGADFRGDAHLPLFGRLKKMGFDTVEIPIMSPDEKAYAELGRRLGDLGLKRSSVTVLSVENNLIGPDPKQRAGGVAHLKAVLDSAQALGAELLVGPIYAALGHFTGSGPTRQEWDWCVEGMKEVAPHAKKAGVVMAAEYLNRFEIYLLNCAADAARMAREVGHPNFKMMYDTFHANIEEKDIAKAVAACKDQLVHVHISENDRSTPGRGGVDWDESFKALKKAKFKGILMIEAFGQKLPELAAATKIWRRMFKDEELLAKEGLAFMKKKWGRG